MSDQFVTVELHVKADTEASAVLRVADLLEHLVINGHIEDYNIEG